MKLLHSKKVLIIFVSIVLPLLILFFILGGPMGIGLLFEHYFPTYCNEPDKNIKTIYNDEFLVKSKMRNKFPERMYYIEIYYKNSSKNLLVFKRDDLLMNQYDSFNIDPIYVSNDLKSYSVLGDIIYKRNGEANFTYIESYKIRGLDVKDFDFLLPVIKKFLNINNNRLLIYTDYCEFMVKCGDESTINQLRLYEKGLFSKEDYLLYLNINDYDSRLENEYKQQMNKYMQVANDILKKINYS